MSILIKGMEMPEDGKTVTLTICADGIVFEEFKEPGDVFHAVPVPAHGDLIGREWLVDISLHLMNTAKNDDIANGVKWLLQYIIESPTIIPASEEGE